MMYSMINYVVDFFDDNVRVNQRLTTIFNSETTANVLLLIVF